MSTTTTTVKTKPLPTYQQVEESKYDCECCRLVYAMVRKLICRAVEWADLVTLDLSKFDAPGGKQELANQLRDALHHVGFFYITNFGLSQEQACTFRGPINPPEMLLTWLVG
jgi:hypothetical protein